MRCFNVISQKILLDHMNHNHHDVEKNIWYATQSEIHSRTHAHTDSKK
jgi:hypothetical protein